MMCNFTVSGIRVGGYMNKINLPNYITLYHCSLPVVAVKNNLLSEEMCHCRSRTITHSKLGLNAYIISYKDRLKENKQTYRWLSKPMSWPVSNNRAYLSSS